MTIWFTSDTHFGHSRMMESRGFGSIDEMDEVLIDAWNVFVRPHDDVYHLGDFALCSPDHVAKIRKRLKGNVRLIGGNHDHKMPRWLADTFAHTYTRYELKARLDPRADPRADPSSGAAPGTSAQTQRIILDHFPLLTWNCAHYGAWHLHGHSHGSLDPARHLGRRMDIGVDTAYPDVLPNHPRFSPYSLAEVEAYMATRQWSQMDGHEPKLSTSPKSSTSRTAVVRERKQMVFEPVGDEFGEFGD